MVVQQPGVDPAGTVVEQPLHDFRGHHGGAEQAEEDFEELGAGRVVSVLT
jgi:hypothetical protein